MFGYLVAATDLLEQSQKERYEALYCGLCRSLGQNMGLSARLTLSYDLTFLYLLLSSLYEPEEKQNAGSCIRHPFTARPWVANEICDYTAYMNVALTYLKCLDDWQDERKLSAYAEASRLKAFYEAIEKKYPRQCQAMELALKKLRDIEHEAEETPDAAANCFGELMEEIFIFKEDRWSPALRSMAHALGCFIYTVDAVIDLEKDVARGSYNPFRSYYGDVNNEQRFRDILKMQLGECLFYFDKLPLVQDVPIMQNILCAGLWARFNKKFGGKDSQDVSGSI